MCSIFVGSTNRLRRDDAIPYEHHCTVPAQALSVSRDSRSCRRRVAAMLRGQSCGQSRVICAYGRPVRLTDGLGTEHSNSVR
jgi:hypothetical protein